MSSEWAPLLLAGGFAVVWVLVAWVRQAADRRRDRQALAARLNGAMRRGRERQAGVRALVEERRRGRL